ncbi:MAG TPA: hypothetical protein VKA31_07630 [Mariprofundaceae bacterium]|nr:hypothetical protein [Mariprofundaceae bacterium]
MSLNNALKELVGEVDGALACAVIDLSSGLMLGVHHDVPYFSQDYVDAVAASAVDMFRGRTIRTVEKLLSAERGKEVANSIKEVQMTTNGTYHFMTIVKDKPDALLVLITDRSANLGMGWTSIRRANTALSPLCP